jgi:hypothetical protein
MTRRPTGAGLGDPERRDQLAADRGAQEALVLLGRSEPEHRRGGDPRMGAEPDADTTGGAGGRQLLGPDRVVRGLGISYLDGIAGGDATAVDSGPGRSSLG